MNQSKLIYTHKKLTILFTGLVFCIVCILGFSTLGAKYFNELRIQRSEFRKGVTEIQRILESENVILQTLLFNRVQQKRKFSDAGNITAGMEGKPFLSFVILDANNDIIFENIIEPVNF